MQYPTSTAKQAQFHQCNNNRNNNKTKYLIAATWPIKHRALIQRWELTFSLSNILQLRDREALRKNRLPSIYFQIRRKIL